MFDEAEDRALMGRIAGGDKEALEALYRSYARAVGYYLYRACYDEALAEDCLQETFLRVWRAGPQWRGEGKVSTFIYQVAKNLMLDVRARRTRQAARLRPEGLEGAAEAATDDGRDPARAAEGAELRALVRRAVAALPAEQREVLDLLQTEGLTYRAAAEVLEIPLGTVKSRMAAAAETLRRRLARHVRA